MTVVAACQFRDGAVILADSRASWMKQGARQDALRKVLHITPRSALAYAGDVAVAACIANGLRKRQGLGGSKVSLYKVATDLPRIAKRCYARCMQRRADCGIELVFSGIDSSGVVSLWSMKSPQFKLAKIGRFAALGSGADAVIPYLEKNFARLDGLADLKSRADTLIGAMESELRRASVDTVGGLFQVITVAADGIRPMSYGFTSMDPESAAPSLSITAVKGNWVQRIEASGTDVPLVEPSAFLARQPSNLIVQELSPVRDSDKTGKWFLSYCIPCLEVKRDDTSIEFRGLWTNIAVRDYPKKIDALMAVGFWGSPGSADFVVSIERAGTKTEIHRESLTVPYPIQIVDVVVPIQLDITASGPAFLDYAYADQPLGRRAIYFGQLPKDIDPKDSAAVAAATAQVRREMYQCADPSLVGNAVALAYWTLCAESKVDPSLLTFVNEVQAVYWKKYPLSFRTSLAAGFRTAPGKHAVRVDLVHATSRAVTPVTTAQVESDSTMGLVQIHGELIVPIPGPGWYFANLYCDDVLVGATMICAETTHVTYSYSLFPKDIEQIDAGELLVVLKRARSAEEMAESLGQGPAASP